MKDVEARLHYSDGAYEVMLPGSFVVCAVTGTRIPLEQLRYWDVARQEPYANASAALQAMRKRDRG